MSKPSITTAMRHIQLADISDLNHCDQSEMIHQIYQRNLFKHVPTQQLKTWWFSNGHIGDWDHSLLTFPNPQVFQNILVEGLWISCLFPSNAGNFSTEITGNIGIFFILKLRQSVSVADRHQGYCCSSPNPSVCDILAVACGFMDLITLQHS